MKKWVNLDTYYEVTDEGDGSDEQWSWQGGTTLYITGAHLTRDEFKRDYNSRETDLDHGFVVAVAYTDGGTFGYDGYCEILEIYPTVEEAKALIERVKDKGSYNENGHYAYWSGYFSSLTSLDYYEF